MNEVEKYIGKSKMTEKPKKRFSFIIGDKVVKTKHLDDAAVTTEKIKDKAVTPEKVSDDFEAKIVLPLVNPVDDKYKGITGELYSMIASLQVGGIALSNKFGDRTDIGVCQKTLTKAYGRIWEILGEIKEKNYMDFTLTVQPLAAFAEGAVSVKVTADSSEAVSDFDSIQIYIDDELVAESSDIVKYITTLTINETSQIKAIGTILGKPITKEATVSKYIPFFMGSGQVYTDIMNEEHVVEMVNNTIEGQYNVEIEHTGDYLFIIIPTSQKHYFRRADMNGWEIPMNQFIETSDYKVYKSQNTYEAGVYNIDIDIDS